MFFRHRRRFFRRRRRFKSRFKRRTSNFRIARRIGVAKRGFVRNYRKAAFASRSRRLTVRKIGALLPAKRYYFFINNTTQTNGAVTTDRGAVFMPMGKMVQGQATAGKLFDGQATFNGIKILLTGIKMQLLLSTEGNYEDFYVRMMCFWCTQDENFWGNIAGDPTAGWTTTASVANTIGTKLAQTQGMPYQFLDLPYGGAGYPDFATITARPNPNYPGKLLYDRVMKMTLTGYNTVGNSTNPTRLHRVWLPFNKEFEWDVSPAQEDGGGSVAQPLLTAPNFGKYGQPVFVLYYVNAEALSGGTQRALTWSTDCRIYFRDV